MFYLADGYELDEKRILKYLDRFKFSILPELEKREAYYNGKQDILRKEASDIGKPNNKIVANFCKTITDNLSGFIAGKGVGYTSTDDIEGIVNTLKYNDYQTSDMSLLHDALIYKYAVEFVYFDANESQIRFTQLPSKECIPVYNTNIDPELKYVIRLWCDEDILSKSYYVDVYGERSIKHYKTTNAFSSLQLLDEEPHYFGMCPCSVLELNENAFDCIITLQDAYNSIISGELDNQEAFSDAYLILKGCVADEEDLKNMKRNKVLMLDEDADADYLTKMSNISNVSTMLDKVEEMIQRVSCVPNLNDETFGTSSGIAIQYKLTSLRNRAGQICTYFKKALQRRLELICSIEAKRADNFIWRDIDINFDWNLPENLQEEASVVTQLRGIVSQKTLLGTLSFVDDVEAELEALAEEDSLYDFNTEPMSYEEEMELG